MATTHLLAGVAVAAGVALVAPEFASLAFVAGAFGGLIPDLDLYAGHRKTLHFPVYYPVAALGAALGAAVTPSPWTVGLAVGLAAAALHSVMDVAGGGLELRPWLARSERAVYDHYRDRWIRPRRWIRYDGAPEDLALAFVLGAPGYVVFGTPLDALVLGVLGISTIYVAIRKPLVAIAVWLVPRLPDVVLEYVPERFLE